MTKDMTTGAITPLLVKFTIPLVLGNLFQLTYNAADSIIVGKFVGEDALAAVGTSNPLMTLAILFINGLCLGAGILVSTWCSDWRECSINWNRSGTWSCSK